MMRRRLPPLPKRQRAYSTTGSVCDYISLCGMGRFRYHRCALRLPDRTHFAGTAEAILAGVMALVNWC